MKPQKIGGKTMAKIELTKEDKQEILSCVAEIKFILGNGLDQGYEAVNSSTIGGYSYDNDDDLHTDFLKIAN